MVRTGDAAKWGAQFHWGRDETHNINETEGFLFRSVFVYICVGRCALRIPLHPAVFDARSRFGLFFILFFWFDFTADKIERTSERLPFLGPIEGLPSGAWNLCGWHFVFLAQPCCSGTDCMRVLVEDCWACWCCYC